MDAQPSGAAAAQCQPGRRATLRTAGQLDPLYPCRAARRGEHSQPEPARAIRAVESRSVRRCADRAGADCRPGKHRTGPPARAGPRLLATERADRGSGDLERRSRGLPATTPRSNPGADCRGRRSAGDGSPRRYLHPTGGSDFKRGPHSVPNGRARHPHRQPGHAGGTAQPARPAGKARSALPADPGLSLRTSGRPRVAA